MATFTYEFYVRCKDPHPLDRRSESDDLNDIAKWYLESLGNLGDERNFNCLISWVGADGERAAIRHDSFMSNGLKTCLGHSEEPNILNKLLQLLIDHDYPCPIAPHRDPIQASKTP